MTTLILGLVIFFGAHSVSIVAPAWRDRTAARIGGNAWRALYSIIAIVGFVLMLRGYGQLRGEPTVLYAPSPWLRYITALLMAPVFPLLLATYFPGRIKTALKHPMLAATKAWALAHLLANGTLGDVLFFGSFLVWAVADRISFKYRAQRPIATAPASSANDWIAVIVGLALYFAFIKWLHVWAFGVSPQP